MFKDFQLNEKVILIYLFIVFTSSLTIPIFYYLNNIYVKILIFVIVILIGLSIHKIINFKFRKPNLINFMIYITFGCFVYSSFFINLENNINSESLSLLALFIINFSLFFIIFSRNLRIDESKFESFTNLIIYFAIVLSIFSLVYYYLGFHHIQMYSHTSAGLFGHPNTTSMFYTICTPVLFYKYFTNKIKFPLFIALLILFLIVLLFTLSRAGYIGVGIGILIYTFYKSKTLFVLVSILILFVTVTIVQDFAATKVDSSASRFLLMMAAISIITNTDTSLLWGYGPANATSIFIQEKFFFGNEPVPNPHNLFLMLAMQFGVVFTLAATLTILIMLFKCIILKFRNSNLKNDQKLNLSITVVISLIIQNIFEDVLVNPIYFVMQIFLVFLGYIYFTLKFQDYLYQDKLKV